MINVSNFDHLKCYVLIEVRDWRHITSFARLFHFLLMLLSNCYIFTLLNHLFQVLKHFLFLFFRYKRLSQLRLWKYFLSVSSRTFHSHLISFSVVNFPRKFLGQLLLVFFKLLSHRCLNFEILRNILLIFIFLLFSLLGMSLVKFLYILVGPVLKLLFKIISRFDVVF